LASPGIGLSRDHRFLVVFLFSLVSSRPRDCYWREEEERRDRKTTRETHDLKSWLGFAQVSLPKLTPGRGKGKGKEKEMRSL